MILKLKTFNEALGHGWKFIDNITLVDRTHPKEKPEHLLSETEVIIENVEGAQKGESEVSFSNLLADCVRTQNGVHNSWRIFTQLPAYLLNDKGETIERLN